ncbi:nuclear transport factor 2 family protein [Rhodococcus opacus]|nr:nuclear transport factor 2 family protein [Rhodococcus opacus]
MPTSARGNPPARVSRTSLPPIQESDTGDHRLRPSLAAASWCLLSEAAVTESDPRLRANLELVARHVDAEVRGDLDALMATLVDDPVYHYWGATNSPGPSGAAAVRAYYEESVAMGRNRLEFAIDRVVPGVTAVVTEGVFRHAYSGVVLYSRGDDGAAGSDGWYLVEYRSVVVWPISEDGLLLGEEVYIGEPLRAVRRLADDEAPHLGPVERYRADRNATTGHPSEGRCPPVAESALYMCRDSVRRE